MEAAFKLGTFAVLGRRFAGMVIGETVHELAASPGGLMDLLDDWDRSFDRLMSVADAIGRDPAFAPSHAMSGLHVLPPIPRPSKILNAASNYSGHLAEMANYAASGGTAAEAVYKGDKSNSEPYLFFKAPSSLTGAFDDIVLPPGDSQVDWEAELAAVIGPAARRVTAADAMKHVAGFMTINDVSCRPLLFRKDRPNLKTDWMASKSWDSFCPAGPFFVPRQFVPDHAQLRIQLSVNGEMRQDGLAGDMIFSPEEQIEFASRMMTLEPGDIFSTGTVAGVGQGSGNFLRPGDIVECEVQGLGKQRNRVVASG